APGPGRSPEPEAGKKSGGVGGLAVRGVVETHIFVLFGNAESDGELRHEQGDKGRRAAPSYRNENTFDLDEDLSVGSAAAHKNAGENGPDDPADAVDPEDVEAVVILESAFQSGRAEVANRRGDRSDDERPRHRG